MGLRKILLTGAAVAFFGAPAAFAADAVVASGAGDAPAATGGPTEVGEVVVTARKREERLKDVPIADTVINAATLERQQIYQVKDIAAFAPGLNINSDSVGRSFVSIRGVGTTLIDTVQPGVGIFIDGIYEPDTSYLNSPLLDVERIEVLRGPQGTLFGNNTLGGAINVITRQPTDTVQGYLSGAYAGPDNFSSVAGSISGPIVSGVLDGRIGASYHHQDGFEKNILAGGDANPLEQRSVNGTLKWHAAPDAVFTLNAYYDQVKGGTTPYVDVTGPDDHSENNTYNLNSIATYTYAGANLKGEFDLSNTKLTLVAAYDQRNGKASGDGDFGPLDFIRVNDGENLIHTYTGEVRADTKWSDSFSTLVGVFADQSTTTESVNETLVPFGLTTTTHGRSELSAQAVYGTAFWKIDPTLELAVGLRFDHQKVEVQGSPEVFEANQMEPRFTLTKHWDSDFMTYASISRGFRGGGANGAGAPNPIYKGDSVWTYELGSKYESGDRKLSLDAAIFYNNYEHYIGQNSLAPSTSGVGFVAINLNSGKVESYGAEFEGVYRPADRWSFNAGLTLLHARITDGTEYVQTTGMALPTDRLLFVPDWNFFATASYTLPILNSDTLRFDGTMIGKGDRVGSTLDAASVPVLKAYYLTNASVTWTHGPIEVALFGTNLFDTKYSESYLDSSLLSKAGLAFLAHDLAIPGDRRRVGVRAKYSF